jgi:hypothetical protein
MSAHHHPLEMSLMVHDSADQDADPDKGDQERDRGDEHAPPRPVGDGGADQESQPGQLQQHQQNHDNQAGKGQQQQCSSSGHTLLKHCRRTSQEGNAGARIFLNRA